MIEKFRKGVMASGAKEANLTTVELITSGGYTLEKGTCILKIRPKSGAPTEQNIKYVVIWKRIADGWKTCGIHGIVLLDAFLENKNLGEQKK